MLKYSLVENALTLDPNTCVGLLNILSARGTA